VQYKNNNLHINVNKPEDWLVLSVLSFARPEAIKLQVHISASIFLGFRRNLFPN
jgi:hypothetical protein